MATIGSPPSGWYTDPSGQHRARYWDGAGWTEQVRDDVGAPSAVSGGEQAHEAAATVANIAQALATVAEQDVAEAPFVVDYGTPEPTPYAPTETPVNPDFDGFGDAASAEAPIAGWYPDPSMRHQARFWDGFKWTERVADGGIEGVDPVPGTEVVQNPDMMAGGVDPAATAWSTQLLGDTNLDGAIPQVATAESMVSAGQASLASLPDREDVDDDGRRLRVPPPVKVVVAGWMIVVGAFALLLGSTMTWMGVRGPRVTDSATATGMSLGDGRITVVLAIALAVLGAGLLTGRLRRLGGTKVAAMGALVAGAAAVAVTAIDIADVADRATRLGVPPGAVTSVGTGLWLCFLGALLAVAGGLMAFANRERTPRI
jgi:Protein of unknown function (DUF2510)